AVMRVAIPEVVVGVLRECLREPLSDRPHSLAEIAQRVAGGAPRAAANTPAPPPADRRGTGVAVPVEQFLVDAATDAGLSSDDVASLVPSYRGDDREIAVQELRALLEVVRLTEPLPLTQERAKRTYLSLTTIGDLRAELGDFDAAVDDLERAHRFL